MTDDAEHRERNFWSNNGSFTPLYADSIAPLATPTVDSDQSVYGKKKNSFAHLGHVWPVLNSNALFKTKRY